jgi:penicillin-binding protein A
VNGRIAHLAAALAAGFAVLIATVTYWQVWAAPSLQARRDNPRLVYRELAIKRGKILTSDGVVLATNRPRRANGRTEYFRTYPQHGLAAHLVGYSSIRASRAGLERSLNDYLTGANTDLLGGFDQLLGAARGEVRTGNDVVLALSAKAQRVALRDLQKTGKHGAVVALDPSTGHILVMASVPGFDPNGVDKGFPGAKAASGAPLLNRATQGLYPPGSTFKVLTAAAAIDGGIATPDSTFKGGTCITVQTRPLCNALGEVAPNPNTLADAFVHSYNTTFAQVGERLGQRALVSRMQAFGFMQPIEFDYPQSQTATSGLYDRPGHLQSPDRGIDAGRTAIGQADVLTTPLQMALVASTIANGGRLVLPQAVLRVQAPGGRVIQRPQPDVAGQPISPQTAATMTDLMRRVVDEGTGQAAQIGDLQVAGKTGTAQTGRKDATGAELYDAWFVAFAPVANPRVAIAVVVEDTPEFGGQISAPIARDVIGALLR